MLAAAGAAALLLFAGIVFFIPTKDGAILRSKRFARNGDWYLKLDVRKYFDSVDFVKETLCCRRYVRYMDDFVIWSDSRPALRRIQNRVTAFLDAELRLELKPPCLNACTRGMTFLGYRVFPNQVRLCRRSRDRFRRKLREFHGNYERGEWSEETTARHVEPLLAFVQRAESLSYRNRAMMQELGLGPRARTA